MLGSSVGDWLGFFAITALADRLGGLSSVGAVFAARIAPGLFFASVVGRIGVPEVQDRLMTAIERELAGGAA